MCLDLFSNLDPIFDPSLGNNSCINITVSRHCLQTSTSSEGQMSLRRRPSCTWEPAAVHLRRSILHLKEIFRCLWKFANSPYVPCYVMNKSSSRHRRLINCLLVDGVAKVEFLLMSSTLVISLVDIKKKYADWICQNKVLSVLPLTA